MTCRKVLEKWECCGQLNDIGRTFICPGIQGYGGWYDYDNLPTGWIRTGIEPKTPNSETTYISTTVWSITVTAGVETTGW